MDTNSTKALTPETIADFGDIHVSISPLDLLNKD